MSRILHGGAPALKKVRSHPVAGGTIPAISLRRDVARRLKRNKRVLACQMREYTQYGFEWHPAGEGAVPLLLSLPNEPVWLTAFATVDLPYFQRSLGANSRAYCVSDL